MPLEALTLGASRLRMDVISSALLADPTPGSDALPSSNPDAETAEAPSAPSPVAVVDPSQLPYLLTLDEVAGLLRTTRRAVYARAERGLLPGIVYDGRRVLVRRDVLLRSLSERRAGSPGATRR